MIRAIWTFLFVVALLNPTIAQDVFKTSKLSFAVSPITKQHLQLQFLDDHHRVHFLVHAEKLRGVPCKASITCSSGEGDSISEVTFTPTKGSETFSVHLRTPRVVSSDADYLLLVDAAGHTGAAYQWQVTRDAKGKGTVDAQTPGTTIEITVEEWTRIYPDPPEEELVFSIVQLAKTRTISVPAGFRFEATGTSRYKVNELVKPIN